MTGPLAMLVTSRGNPEWLLMMCLAFIRTAKSPDLIRFCIRVDTDDLETIAILPHIAKHMRFNYIIDFRPTSLGACVNKLAAGFPEADYYCVLNDDVLPMTENWDEKIRETLDDGDVSVWAHSNGQESADYPILTKKWVAAQGGKIFTAYFPFWFDDRWLNDVVVIGAPERLKRVPIQLLARKAKTQRMRDLKFWFDYYVALEPERLDQAQAVCDALGTGVNVRTDPIRVAYTRKLRETHTQDSLLVPISHASSHDAREPGDAYRIAKRIAEDRMRSAA